MQFRTMIGLLAAMTREKTHRIFCRLYCHLICCWTVKSGKHTYFLTNNRNFSQASKAKSKVVTDAGIALESSVVCEEALERELLIANS